MAALHRLHPVEKDKKAEEKRNLTEGEKKVDVCSCNLI